MTRVSVKPELLHWALDRAGLPSDALRKRFPKIGEWLQGETAPTLKQLEAFARATHAPIGYLFLQAPPVEGTPIPDFRTMPHPRMGRPSPELLDTIYLCQQRQEWYREFARLRGEAPLPFVATARAVVIFTVLWVSASVSASRAH